MNKQILLDKLENLQTRHYLSRDHVELQVLTGQIELLEVLLEALE